MKTQQETKYRAIPKSQTERFLRLGTMSASIVGNMLASATSNMITGEKLSVQKLLMTERNMRSFVAQLSHLRGAALKLGQLLSLEGGDFIPEQVAKILAEVRNEAYRMPPAQLRQVLKEAWGENFLGKFRSFDINPIAAASVGQVHKCKTVNNKTLAIKVQYPGVKESINSDIKNIGFLLKSSGLIPSPIPLDELLFEAKNQLHQEVDYIAESQYLNQFSKLLKNDPHFDVPTLDVEFSTNKTLAMDFKSGINIDKLVSFNQETKNSTIEKLIALILMEIFEFNLIQTDPNFANFLYDESTCKIVLLDFGATKPLDTKTVNNFRMLINAGLRQNTEEIKYYLNKLELIRTDLPQDILNSILDLIKKYSLPVIEGQLFDFSNPLLIHDMEMLSKKLMISRKKIAIPPINTLLIQRKIGGIFLLARRFRASINLKKIIDRYI